jgi:hypothetical protein
MSLVSELNDNCFVVASVGLKDLVEAFTEEMRRGPTADELAELLSWGVRSLEGLSGDPDVSQATVVIKLPSASTYGPNPETSSPFQKATTLSWSCIWDASADLGLVSAYARESILFVRSTWGGCPKRLFGSPCSAKRMLSPRVDGGCLEEGPTSNSCLARRRYFTQPETSPTTLDSPAPMVSQRRTTEPFGRCKKSRRARSACSIGATA